MRSRALLGVGVMLLGHVLWAMPSQASGFFDCLINFYSSECRRPPHEVREPEAREVVQESGEKAQAKPAGADAAKGPGAKKGAFPLPLAEGTPVEMKVLLDDPNDENAERYAEVLEDALGRVDLSGVLVAQAMRKRWLRKGRLGPEGAMPESIGRALGAESPVSPGAEQDAAMIELPDIKVPTILYFSKDTCPWCVRQEPILERIRRKPGREIEIITVTRPDWMTGARPLPYRKIVSEELVRRAGVEYTPTFLFLKPGRTRIDPPLVGLQSEAAIEEGLAR